jgi:dihydrofolate reductase / thymidylate synthase
MKLIVAYQGCDRGIGKDNKIPWYIPEDLKQFKEKTLGSNPNSDLERNVVVMGRKTWESLPENYRPLKNRINYVVTNNTSSEMKQNIENNLNTFVVNDLDTQLRALNKFNNREIWIIGGQSIYKTAIALGFVTEIYVTEVYSTSGKLSCDTFFPKINMDHYDLTKVSKIYESTNTLFYRFLVYTNKAETSLFNKDKVWRSNEQQYLDTLKEIIDTGQENIDRTGVGTMSVFGKQFKYDLSQGLPVLTTKRIFLRAIFEELMLYLRGQTDNTILQDKNIHIWDGNTSRDFLDSRNLQHYPVGDMGETYGFNFRHFGGEYVDCRTKYTPNDGFDQLEYVINEIKTNPHSRRIIINLWNPNTLVKAALPSCLCQYQFYVNTKTKTLNLQIYIRSSDFFLANNWNTCTGAFFVYMICNLKGIDLSPGELTVVTGDTHIYLTHLEGVKENLLRIQRPQPIVKINSKKDHICDFEWDDLNIIGYIAEKNIRAEMAV